FATLPGKGVSAFIGDGKYYAGNEALMAEKKISTEKIKKELSLADELEILLCVAIGKPDETVVLEELEKGGLTSYYRDENNVHHVPKRKLEDIIINAGASD
ncbi:MAG: hypothetical protein IJD67_05625, partial [Clostridia bacterium]|nr:hypothetical protein [Clostridia bacterium]